MSPLNRPITSLRGQRVWLIGASSGIGAALAKTLLNAGARVILSARRAERLQILAHGHAEAIAAPFDIRDHAAWPKQYASICKTWGGIDLFLFCAADYHPEHSWQVDPSKAADMLNTNLTSAYAGLATVLPDMLERATGGIALVASVAGYVGLPNASVYGPSKAALINLAELLYTELHPRGLNVYLINPGFVQTPLTAKNDFAMPALQTPEAAAHAIVRGLTGGDFEIHFPKRFTWLLKFLRLLPYRLRFALTAHLLKPI